MINPSQVQDLKARGLTQQAVALKLGCSERTVRTHWKPDAEPLVEETVSTALQRFERIADDDVATETTLWATWNDDYIRPCPGTLGKAWKTEQYHLQAEHRRKIAKPATLPLLVPTIEPEAATGNRQSIEELPVIAPNDFLAPVAAMSSEYEARMRLVKSFPRFEHPTVVRSRDLFAPKERNWFPMIWVVALLLFTLLFATTHYHVVQPLSGPFAPSVSLMR